MNPGDINPSERNDAIVVGTGIIGGRATRELCEKGLRTLVLERGRMVKHPEHSPNMRQDPRDFPSRNNSTLEERKNHQKQLLVGWVPRWENAHLFVNDPEHPYQETKRFDWIRGYRAGGGSCRPTIQKWCIFIT